MTQNRMMLQPIRRSAPRITPTITPIFAPGERPSDDSPGIDPSWELLVEKFVPGSG